MTTGSRLDGPIRPDIDLIEAAKRIPACQDVHLPWRSLSALPQKADLYWRETTYRESHADLTSALGDDFAPLLQRLTSVVFRPEGIVGRRIEAGLRYLSAHGFDIVHWRFVPATPAQAREVWRYQWNVATLDRIAVFDLITAQAPWLVLLLEDTTPQPFVPASVRLRGLKGSALPERRSGDSLRCSINAPNRILSVLHAPDEPMDVVREFGILFTRRERLAVAEAMRAGLVEPTKPSATTVAKAAYSVLPTEVDFDLQAAAGRVLDILDARQLHGAAASLHAALANDESLPFRDWVNSLDSVADEMDQWDLITVGSFLATHDIEEETCTIDDDGRLEWFGGHGRMEWKGTP